MWSEHMLKVEKTLILPGTLAWNCPYILKQKIDVIIHFLKIKMIDINLFNSINITIYRHTIYLVRSVSQHIVQAQTKT